MNKYPSINSIPLFLLTLLISCAGNEQTKADTETSGFVSTDSPIDCGAFCNPPSVTYILPDTPCNMNEQKVLNCFAWSNFLALNWKASGTRGMPDTTLAASGYGMPGDFSPTVWESFLSVDDIFTTQGANFKSKQVSQIKRINQISKIGTVLKTADNKLLKSANDKIDELFQAQGYWLTDQSGNLVWYEEKVNGTESDFIQKYQLYNSAALNAYAVRNQGVWLPIGSMELKASWKVVPAKDVDAAKPFYKMSKAMIPQVLGFDKNKQPVLGSFSEQYLALTGLHIICKTQLAPQFIWMTFEHIHNAPTENQVDSAVRYSFYNSLSKATPNQTPQPGKDSLSTPVQVVRIANNALTKEIQTLNRQVQDLVRQSNPNSVWQYYQLVNVQWPQNAVQDSDNNRQVPLKTGGITPSNIANTTMETYVQSTQCMTCHQYGSVNGTKLPTGYSFVFSRAKP